MTILALGANANALRTVAMVLGGSVAVLAGCNALLDISEIEFGDVATGGAGATGGNAGLGGQGNQGGTGATGLGGTGGSGNQGVGGPNGGTGGSGGSGGTGGSIPPCPENCTNGVDDDDNGLVDCEDSCCTDHRCVPAIPSQWSGPVALYIGGNGGVGCPATWPTVELDGATAFANGTAASCSGCGCGPLSGASCTTPQVSFWSAAGCAGAAAHTQAPTPNVCTNLTAAGPFLSARAAAPTATGGSCTPSGGAPTVVPYTITEYALACGEAATGAGCGAQEVCMPAGLPPFVPSVCIIRAGDRQCSNTGAFNDRHLVYAGISDTRGCTACSCTPTGVSCGGNTDLFSATNCSGTTVSTPNNGTTCTGTAAGVLSMDYTPTGPTGGSCATGGGAPTGSVSLQDPYTLCCLL